MPRDRRPAFKKAFPTDHLNLTGEFRRQLEIINKLEWVTTIHSNTCRHSSKQHDFSSRSDGVRPSIFTGPERCHSVISSTPAETISTHTLFETSCSGEFLEAWNRPSPKRKQPIHREEDIFAGRQHSLHSALSARTTAILDQAAPNSLPMLIQPDDIRAIIHSHSNWSDGSNTLEEMAGPASKRATNTW